MTLPTLILDFHPDAPDKPVTTKHVGYWEDPTDPYVKRMDLPMPQDSVDEAWDEATRDLVADYLDTAPNVQWWRGGSRCRICGDCYNGSTDKSDGVYTWPEGYGHYVRVHSVKPPEEMLKHILSTRVLKETRTLACGCVIPWDSQWFERLQKLGESALLPGQKAMSEQGVLEDLEIKHVCKRAAHNGDPFNIAADPSMQMILVDTALDRHLESPDDPLLLKQWRDIYENLEANHPELYSSLSRHREHLPLVTPPDPTRATNGHRLILVGYLAQMMLETKLPEEFVQAVTKLAYHNTGAFELMSIWAALVTDQKGQIPSEGSGLNPEEAHEIVIAIQELLDDYEQRRKPKEPPEPVDCDKIEVILDSVRAHKKRLRSLVEANGGIRDLASRMGVPEPYLNRALTSGSMPREVTLRRLAAVIGVPYEDITGEWVS